MIEGVVAQGDCRVIYHAIQIGIGRPAVVMTPQPGTSSDDRSSYHRFEREVLDAARLRHPHAISILDAGHTKDSLPYVVTERLEGRTLAEVLSEEKQLKPKRAQQILVEILEAVGAAHELAIIHKDLTPSNIQVSDSRGKTHVKVTNFGIARVAITQQAITSAIPAMALASKVYAAPELLAGESVGRHSDLYSIGVIAYVMLTGELPNMAIDESDGARAALAKATASTTLQTVVLRLLERDIDARYETAAQALDTLRPTKSEHAPLPPAPKAIESKPPPPKLVEPAPEPQTPVKPPLKEPVASKQPALEKQKVYDKLDPDDLEMDDVPQIGSYDKIKAIPRAVATEIADPPIPTASEPVELRPSGSNFFEYAETLASASPEAPTSHHSLPRRPLIAAAIVSTLALVGCVIALVLMQGTENKTGNDDAMTVTTADADSTPRLVETDSDNVRPSSVTITIETRPGGAHVIVDGVVLGRTPFEFETPPSDEPVAVTLRRDGYQELPISLSIADDDTKIFKLKTSRTR